MNGTSGPDVLVGTESVDFIDGGAGNDTISGLGGNDELVGGDDNDVLNGGAGTDRMTGGFGNDTFYVDNIGDRLFEAIGGGTDTVWASTSYALAAGAEIETLSTSSHGATTAINLAGNAFANTIYGNAGSNVLNGGAGADRLIGLLGNDSYHVDDIGDRVIEAANGGNDTVWSSVSYALVAGVAVETLSTSAHGATTAINLSGNEIANILYGNAGANVLNGGAGADQMIGLLGNDSYHVDNSGDRVAEGANGGNDTIWTSVSYAIGSGVEVETLSTSSHAATTAINLAGNAFANTLYGNAGNNVLNGGGGADQLVGMLGNDTYHVDNAGDDVVEAAGAGNDAVFASVSYVLGAGVSVEALSTSANGATTAINLTGNELANTIYGNAGVNVLDGGGAADVLVGFAGADRFAFTTALGGGNIDRISDFQPGVDKIVLDGTTTGPFSALASGALRAGTFVTGAAALDADDRLIYNMATGALSYDADGNGGAAAVQFATLSTGLALTATDFLVSGPANHLPTVTSGATGTVTENSAAGTIVYDANASDADGDAITYSLAGTDASAFTIDSRTGVVRINSSPDFEVKSQYSISVLALDSSGSASKAVTINVTNIAEGSTPVINETTGINDTRSTAQTLARGAFVIADNPNLDNDSLPSVTVQGNLPNSTDQDFYAITLNPGEQLILDVDNSGGNLDADVHVYDSAGNEVASNDDPGSLDPGSDPHPTYGHNTDSFIRYRPESGGTFYVMIESLQDPENPTSGSYQLNVSIGPPATPDQILQEDVDALLSGTRWNDLSLTYAFPDSYTDFPAGFGDGEATATSGYQAFNSSQRAATTEMLSYIAQVTNLSFQLITDPSGSSDGNADLTFAESDVPEVAYAYLPVGPEGGSAWFNHADFNSPVRGTYDWMGIYHEASHALGLKHGHEAPAVSPDHDTLEYTIMTYRSYVGASVGADGGYTNETGGYPQTLMMLDIAALQQLYGADFSYNSGDSVYRWSPSSGQFSINGTGQWTPVSNRVFMTVWDGSGNDTYDLSNYANAVQIDLRPGEWTRTSSTQLANLGDGFMARGNVANALLYNDDPRSLIENAIGGAGNDTLVGNSTANHLTGGGGVDTFRWFTAQDIGRGAGADTIVDLQRGQDKIDLSALDANGAAAGDGSFTFVGTNAFSGQAGELRYQAEGGSAHVQGDLDGNGVADFDLFVSNTQILASTDFVL